MATAACAPSAAATITNCTSREASPATYNPGTFVSAVSPLCTPPLRVKSQPNLVNNEERCV